MAGGVKISGDIAKALQAEVRRVRDAFHKEVAPVAERRARELSPVAEPNSGGRPPGVLRESWKTRTLKRKTRVLSTAPHALILDRGIRTDNENKPRKSRGQKLEANAGKTKVRKKTRRTGSPKAPEGIVRPLEREMRKVAENVVDAAIRKGGK